LHGRLGVNKGVLVEELAARLIMPRHEAATAVQAIVDAMVTALVRGDKIELRGFGSFHVRLRRARVGHNPKTGARIAVPARRVVYFHAGREVRRLLGGNPTARQ